MSLFGAAAVTGISEQNSVRIAIVIFIIVAIVAVIGYRVYRVRKNHRDQAFFEHMSHANRDDPPHT